MNLMAKTDYSPPFAEQLPDGTSIEYGPSPTTHARHLAEFRQWSWRPDKLNRHASRSPEADKIRAYVRLPNGHFRCDIPRRELEIYVRVFEQGRGQGWVAKKLKISKSTVKTYIKRLRKRASK